MTLLGVLFLAATLYPFALRGGLTMGAALPNHERFAVWTVVIFWLSIGWAIILDIETFRSFSVMIEVTKTFSFVYLVSLAVGYIARWVYDGMRFFF